MNNRWLPVIALVIFIFSIATGCGVSRSEYDAAAIELDLVKQDKQELQTQLQDLQSQLTDAAGDLARAQVELETTQDQLDTTKGELETTQSDLEAAQAQLQTEQAGGQTAQAQIQELQSQLAAATADIQGFQAQVQSLQNDLDAARIAPAAALDYVAFMDILMYEVWLVAGITPNYTFLNAGEYHSALNDLASSIGDPQLMGFIAELQAGPVDKDRVYQMSYYCLDKAEEILQ